MIEEKPLNIQSFTSKQVQYKYPYIRLKELNDTTPLVVSMLEEGDIPLLAEYKGITKVISHISSSAYNIDKLIRTHSGVVYCKAASDEREIYSAREYLEVISGWIL